MRTEAVHVPQASVSYFAVEISNVRQFDILLASDTILCVVTITLKRGLLDITGRDTLSANSRQFELS